MLIIQIMVMIIMDKNSLLISSNTNNMRWDMMQATADKTILTSKRVASCSMVRQLANGWKLGMYWHASRYSLHGGMFQELSPSLQIEMAERTRKGPIGDWTRISEGVDCTPQQRHTSNQQLASRAAAQ